MEQFFSVSDIMAILVLLNSYSQMKKSAILSFALCIIAGSAAMAQVRNQPGTKLRPDETVLLYGDRLIDNTDPVVAAKVTSAGFDMLCDNGLAGEEKINPSGNIGNIGVNARFDLYFPKKPNGQMVIVCPGGGYGIVSSYNEGLYVADWMLSKGITVAVVKYRLPNGHWEVPLTDVQNTFRYCRAHAEEWGVSQIGVMGFSAGGHLACSASNLFVDDVTRPDFSILMYPVITFGPATHGGTKKSLIGPESRWNDRSKSVSDWEKDMAQYAELQRRYTLENQVSENTPVTFLAHCTDDSVVPVINSIMYYTRLVDKGVPAEMHIYPAGGHGWGFSSEKFVGKGNDRFIYARQEFEKSLERWLKGLAE